jgi:hypothetical protein
MALGTSHRVSPLLVQLVLAVYQQLLGHVRTTESRMGSGQCCTEEGRVPLEVNDKSIIMFFKKGLRDSYLIHKLTMKNPKTSEDKLAITNKCTLAKEATIYTKEQKRDKESGHSDQLDTSKSQDKRRKMDCSVVNIERPHCNKEYQPRLGEFEGFLDQIYIFQTQGKRKTQDCDRIQGFIDEVLKTTKKG